MEPQKGPHRSCRRERLILQTLGGPQGWIKHCQVMGWQWRRGNLSYHLWTTWPATLSTGTLLCLFSTTVCQTEQHHGGCWVLLVIHGPQSPCLSKRQDRCKGLNRMNQASVCVGSCVLLQAAASDWPAKLGLGLSWYQGLKGRVLGHCAILCDPMDLNPPCSSMHEGREGSAQLGPGVWAGQVTWWLYPPADLGSGRRNKGSNFSSLFGAKNFKNIISCYLLTTTGSRDFPESHFIT